MGIDNGNIIRVVNHIWKKHFFLIPRVSMHTGEWLWLTTGYRHITQSNRPGISGLTKEYMREYITAEEYTYLLLTDKLKRGKHYIEDYYIDN